jgi:hypothetical protein
MSHIQNQRPGFTFWTVVVIAVAIAYVLSSGPVLATAFWLREKTHRDGFYFVMWVYYPLVTLRRDSAVGIAVYAYIEWWVVDLFGTVGPG